MEKIIIISKEQEKLEKTVANLFSKIYTSDKTQIINELYNRQIIVFVILWSIFEGECINNRKKSKHFNVAGFVKKNYDKINQEIVKEHFDYFNKRYRDNINKYRSLINFSYYDNSSNIKYNHRNYEMYNIFDENYHEPNLHDERLLFLVYIIYRFRCNIFHGNKEVFDWKNNKSPINHCCKALIQIIFNIHPDGHPNKIIKNKF